MNVNDERFFDLAMKVIVRRATDVERGKLDELLAREPDMRAQFARLQADVRVAKGALPLVDATLATTGELPAYARGRLQTKVRQTLGRPKSAAKEPDCNLAWGWRWVLGLAAATVVVVIVALPIFRTPNAPVIQVAILDTARVTYSTRTYSIASRTYSTPGVTYYRGTRLEISRDRARKLDTAGGTRGIDANELATLQATWKESPVQNFSSASELEAWEKDWSNSRGRPAAKIIYDAAAGEVRVSGHSQGKAFQKTFPLEKDLATTLQQISAFVQEQTKK
jgi:hypothetical protein